MTNKTGLHDSHAEKKSRKRRVFVWGIGLGGILAGFLLVFYFCCGLFIIQPVKAIPEGVTFLYFRSGTKLPFVASADGLLLKQSGKVSLLGRVIVLSQVSEELKKRKLAALPYSHNLYLFSTGGKEFSE
jgi:hypothetical protein